MTDWTEQYGNLPDSELDKIAVLRVMECTNGVIQYAWFRPCITNRTNPRGNEI